MGILQLINVILFWVFFGCLASFIARRRGRNPFVWFALAPFLGIFSILLVLALPNLKKVQRRAMPPPLRHPQRSDLWLKLWYYMDPMHARQGPLEFPDLAKLLKEKKLSDASLVWGEGMKEWKQLAELPDLRQEMEQT